MMLKLLKTGVPGLDEIFGGGLPELSFNIVAGVPGSGKTTLCHQIAFHNASPERKVLYFTVLGEPAIKMLRYQQQMAFFDVAQMGTDFQMVDLSAEVLAGDLALLLAKIVRHVEALEPGIVVVDSFRTVIRTRMDHGANELELQGFLQRLALHLTSWQVTSLLIGEYGDHEREGNPVFTIADGIFWLAQSKDRNSMVRQIEVRKIRGRASIPGLHTFRISKKGLRIFPRIQDAASELPAKRSDARAGFGIAPLDKLLGGGLPVGGTTLITGPSGTGKTLLGTHFLVEGARRGEAAVAIIFEEHPEDYIARAEALGLPLAELVAADKLRVIYLRPLDLSASELLHQIQDVVKDLGATRLVLDSLNGLELALAPAFRADFQESMYRLLANLSRGGVSIIIPVEARESFSELSFGPHAISFLAQNIICLRYVEIESELKKMLAVVKMRRSAHSTELYGYRIGDRGFVLNEKLAGFHGIITGVPTPRTR